MQLVKPSFEIKWHMSRQETLELLEWAGRTCYKSQERIGPGTAEKFVRMIRSREHDSVIEHVSATVKFVIDRGVSHELVRHRLASYSQESTRFCDYEGGHVTFVIPPWVDIEPGIFELVSGTRNAEAVTWARHMLHCEIAYKELREAGWKPEQARSVLPNSLKTEVVATYNLRTWRHVFKMRTAEKCHPQMKEVMRPLAMEFLKELPEIFSDECQAY